MMTFLFWFFFCLIVYCLFGYPLLLVLVRVFYRNPPVKGDMEPFVSVVLSVWNEEDVIARKMENLFALDYPPEKMEILVGSDGSTDETCRLIQGCQDPRVRLVEGPTREGKMRTLNRLLSLAKGEIIVLTDARQEFAKGALRCLVRNFSDPTVGCASGELVFFKGEGATARGINVYWNYEKFLRHAESDLHSMLGATGAIYAIRRELFRPIPPNVVVDDMYVPLKIITLGYRAVFDPSAKAYDQVADSPREEYRRKARTLSGNYQIFWAFKELFNPWRSPVAIQMFSHKLLRVLMPFFMAAVFILNGFLVYSDVEGFGFRLYHVFLGAQTIFYGMAVTGALTRQRTSGPLQWVARACYLPYVFCLLNFSALVGFFRYTGAKQPAAWEKARGG